MSGCAPEAPHGPYAVTTQTNLAYGPLPAEQGDLYLPQGTPRPPVVVLIHGGGWVTGNRAGDVGLARLIAMRGVAVFNIDYRLAKADDPQTRWPAQIVDAQLAVRWLRGRAGSLGVDGARMGASGDSAGGHLALLLAVTSGIVQGDQAGLYANQRPEVSAVADQFGPTDLATLPAWVHGVYPPLFGTANPAPEQVAALSPLPQISRRTGPVLIVQGDADDIVPAAQSQALQAALRAQGVPVEYVAYSGGHGFQGLDGNAIYGIEQRVAAWFAARLLH